MMRGSAASADRVPEIRILQCNDAPVEAGRDFVLYWMIAFRRTQSNFALQRAVEWARELKKPLLIFEPLRVGYRWASDRLHRFILDGMADNAARIAGLRNPGVTYYPYVEPAPNADKGLLKALADRSCVVVTDEYPVFFLPRMVAAAAAKLAVRLEQVDSNGLLPLRATDQVFSTAHAFRRFLQQQLPRHIETFPKQDPLKGLKLPAAPSLHSVLTQRWPLAGPDVLAAPSSLLAGLPIDHQVGVVSCRGGSTVARRRLRTFLNDHLEHYAELGNEPDADVRSGLSPYFHFGHISPHETFLELMESVGWEATKIAPKPTGSRSGWWGAGESAEAWLDEFVTWRELGFNMTSKRTDYDRYESLPSWARVTLEKHATDRREYVYSLDQFAIADTHDLLWNAAQNQLVREGRVHNYLRMLWGKKILEWSASPRQAIEVMLELNNRYALDGRDPNSYSGIFWCLGRYDRPWGPERPIFGTVRYMSSENTRRKLCVRDYLEKYGSRQAEDRLEK